MKKHNSKIVTFAIAGCLILIIGSHTYAETYVSGTQSGYWGVTGSPYIVTGDITVPADSVLEIEAGVDVLFQGTYRIYTDGGTILALGTASDSIKFKPADGYTYWGSLQMQNTPIDNPCIYQYCYAEYANGSPLNSRWGGVFWVNYGSIIVENSRFMWNSGYTGPVMYAAFSTVSIDSCEMFYGFSDWCHGALGLHGCEGEISRTVICHNTATAVGGGIYPYLGEIDIINCTIAYNTAYDGGGGLFIYPGGTVTDVVNCIIYGNTGGNIVGPGWANVIYSDIGGGWPGIGNINADPMFVDQVNNDFHLLANSPCIDAGDPGSPPDPDGTIADMGAYYFDQPGFVPGTLTVYAEPDSPPVVIPPEGGSFDFSVSFTCDLTNYAIFDTWTEFIFPNGQVHGPRMLRESNYIAAGDSLSRELEIYLAAYAMPGTYEYWQHVGDYPDSIWTSASFTIEKEEPTDGFQTGQGSYLILSGWDMTERINVPSYQQAEFTTSQHIRLTSTPNPFNPKTTIQFSLLSASHVSLTVYDLSGRLVATLLDRHLNGGSHSITFDGNRMASGIYLAVMEWNNQRAVERLLLLK